MRNSTLNVEIPDGVKRECGWSGGPTRGASREQDYTSVERKWQNSAALQVLSGADELFQVVRCILE